MTIASESDALSQFLQGKDDDSTFLAHTNKYWNHGMVPPHTVFKYYPSKRLTNRIYLNENQGYFYKPMASFEPVSHSTLYEETDQPASGSFGDHSSTSKLLRSSQSEEHLHALSGYYSIPKVTLNVPSESVRKHHDATVQSEISGFVYSNHISLDDYAYTFGGLCFNKTFKFSDFGIPDDTDPEKISVYLPVDLPPHIDRDVLMNPYLESNHHFYLYNPHRGTVTVLDSLVSNVPKDLHSMSCTQVSSRHVFTFGGFYLKVKQVRYVEAIDRWIIEKSFKLNESGFLLDTVTFNFTEIKLNKQVEGDDDFAIGRLGNTIIGNIYEQCFSCDSGSSNFRVPTPSNYVDSAHFSPYIPSIGSSSSTSSNTPQGQGHNRQGSTLFKTRSGGTPSNNHAGKTVINTKPHLNSQPATPASSGGNSYFQTTSSSSPDSSAKSKRKVGAKDIKKKTNSTLSKVIDKIHSNSSSHSNNSSISSPVQATAIGTASTRGTSPLLSDALNVPVSLQSSYSNQVRQHRSNSGSVKSRPVSPVPGQAILAPKPIAFRDDTAQTTDMMHDLAVEEEPEDKCDCSDMSSGLCDSCVKQGKVPKSPHDLFGNTILEPGQALTSVFVFGGFVEKVEDGIQKFKATNDFLRIDLECDGEYLVSNIKPEASIYRIHIGEEEASSRPSPRGYFASTLVEYNEDDEELCDWNHYTRPFSPTLVFDEDSSVSSIPTSNSRYHGNSMRIKTPEEFFERKALLVHGGCNENNETFAEMFLFKFNTGEWESISSYCYDYFDNHIDPYDDDNGAELTLDKAVKNPSFVEAELRASHHTALYYNKQGRELIFFIGGFNNHYLRDFATEEYHSDKFDVSRLGRNKVIPANPEVCRVIVYNIKTQTWGFYKAQYDLRKNIANKTMDKLKSVPSFIDANIYHHGSGISLNGKIITIFHGLVNTAAAKRSGNKEVVELHPYNSVLFGCHVQITFPAL